MLRVRRRWLRGVKRGYLERGGVERGDLERWGVERGVKRDSVPCGGDGLSGPVAADIGE